MSSSSSRLVFAMLISFGLAIFVEQRVFVDAYAINDDVRNQIYWMARFIDPEFFQADYIAAYFSQPSMISPIVAWLYHGFSFFADPKILTQYLPFVIITATTYVLFKASELHAGSKYAFWICLSFNSYIWMMKYTAGGLPRAFFYLLFFWFFWMLARRAWGWLVFCIALQALIYPTACFLSLFTLIVEVIRTSLQGSPALKSSGLLRHLWLLAMTSGLRFAMTASFIVSAIILCSRYLLFKVPGFGPLTSLEQALKMPDFYLDGRACVFVWPFSFTQEGIDFGLVVRAFVDFFDNAYVFIILITFILVLLLLFKKFLASTVKLVASPHYLWSSSIASLGLFVIAYLSLFYLYLPHRYIAYTLPLIPVYIIGALFYKLEMTLAKRPLLIWLAGILFLLSTSSLWREDLIQVGKAERKLHQFLSTTPKQALIAAPLKLSSNIPAFAYRSVLVSSETNIPFHQTYYHKIKERERDLSGLYQSKDMTYISSFVEKYKVDYVVIDLNDSKLVSDSPLLTLPNSVYQNKRFRVLAW